MKTQDSTAKEFKLKKSRPKNSKLANKKTFALLHTNKSRKNSYQKKKKKYFNKKQNIKNSILAMRDNAIESEKKWNNQNNRKCYNCQKRAILLETILNH